MWRTAVPEAVDVLLGSGAVGVDGGVMLAHLRSEKLCVVDTLGAREDLLAAHEHVVRVGQKRVVRRGHCVGGAERDRELVQDIEVGVVLLEDEAAEVLFLGGAAGKLVHQTFRRVREC